MKTTKKILTPFSKIELLNLPEKETSAHIAVHCRGNLTSRDYSKKAKYEIKIADCNSHIFLHGSLNNTLSRKNGLHKINTLIQTLTEFKDHIIDQMEQKNVRVKQ